MDDFNLNSDLDVSQLSAVDLQRISITVAQVRAVFANPVATIEPDATLSFPDIWQLLGFTSTGQFVFVALKYDDSTRKLAALAVRVADDLAELRYHLCPVSFS